MIEYNESHSCQCPVVLTFLQYDNKHCKDYNSPHNSPYDKITNVRVMVFYVKVCKVEYSENQGHIYRPVVY